MHAFGYKVGLFILMSNAITYSYAQEWSEASPMPVALQEIYTDSHKGFVYIAGGIPEEDAYVSDDFFRYSAMENKWGTLPPMPESRHHVTISTVNDQIYAIGGFSGQFPNWQAQDSVFVYNLKSNKWTKSESLPSPRGEHVSATVNGKVYVIGGRVRENEQANHFEKHVDTKLNQVFCGFNR